MRRRHGPARREIAAKVVDNSALVAVAFMEPRGALVADRLRDHELHAPELIRYEWANVAARKMTEHPEDLDNIRSQAQTLGERTVVLHDIDLAAVIALAYETGLSGYDASYLWLSETLGVELVTLDGPLAKVIASRGSPS